MTDNAASALEQANAALVEERRKFDSVARAFLARIGAEFPARAEEAAKKQALKEPHVAEALGTTGLKKLRQDLSNAASALAQELQDSAHDIRWGRGGNTNSSVHHALFTFMYGARIDKLNKIIREAGFRKGDKHGDMVPQELYDQRTFDDMVEALDSLEEVEQVQRQAEAAAKRANVESLWDSSD